MSQQEQVRAEELPGAGGMPEWQRYIWLTVGMIVGVAGFQAFTVPVGIYNGGIVGLAQLARTLLVDGFGLSPSLDLSGPFNLLFNVPLMFLAWRTLSRRFFFRTLYCVLLQTLILSVVVVKTPPMDDPLTAAVIAGVLGGAGIGIVLRAGGSTAGLDILGVWLSKYKLQVGVGTITNTMNACIYLVFAVLFDLQTAIYSIVFAFVCAVVTDKVHIQNINCGVLIVTECGDLAPRIARAVARGATRWQAAGGHTGREKYVYFIVVNKYEEPILRRVVAQADPEAFVAVGEGLQVYGHFIRRLS